MTKKKKITLFQLPIYNHIEYLYFENLSKHIEYCLSVFEYSTDKNIQCSDGARTSPMDSECCTVKAIILALHKLFRQEFI